MELYAYPAHHLHRLFRKGEVSSQEITESVFHRIEQLEPRLNAFITLMKTAALDQAKDADQMIRRGTIGPLTGISDGGQRHYLPKRCTNYMWITYLTHL